MMKDKEPLKKCYLFETRWEYPSNRYISIKWFIIKDKETDKRICAYKLEIPGDSQDRDDYLESKERLLGWVKFDLASHGYDREDIVVTIQGEWGIKDEE